jgi:uncharacterized membrane protein YdbT with pleckstrin-like domain
VRSFCSAANGPKSSGSAHGQRWLLLGVIIVGVFIFVRSWIIMATTDFAVTNRRVILKTGWLNRRTQELAVESVEGVILD